MPRRRLPSPRHTYRFMCAGALLACLGSAGAIPAVAQPSPEPLPPRFVVAPNGNIVITDGANVLGSVGLSITAVDFYAGHADQENNASQVRSRTVDGRRIVDGVIEVPGSGGRRMEFHEEVTPVNGMEVKLTYRCKFPEAVTIFGYFVSIQFPVAPLLGQPVHIASGPPKTITIGPDAPAMADAFYHIGSAGEVRAAPDHPCGLTVTPSEDMHVLMQDNRSWGGDIIDLRYHFRSSEQREAVPAGDTMERTITIHMNRSVRFLLDPSEGDATDTRGWVPYAVDGEKPAFDLSFLNEKPAGLHGFVHSAGDRFAFQDGTRARFWGTSLAGASAFPTKEEAAKTARRLAACGVNLVRVTDTLSGGEAPLVKAWAGDTPRLDAEVVARLDNLIAALKAEGIYVCLDQNLVPSQRLGRVPPSANPYAYFDAATMARNKAIARALWSHVNPLTGVAYKDEPAIAMVELTNACDLFIIKIVSEPHRGRLEELYRAWAAQNGVPVDAKPVDFATLTAPVSRFLTQVQREYYGEMAKALRSAGVRVPIAGSAWGQATQQLASLAGLDYIHSHASCDNPTQPIGGDPTPYAAGPAGVYPPLLLTRLAGKPYLVTSWGVPWSCDWRAEYTLGLSAVAALQEWDGLALHVFGDGSGDTSGRIRVPECSTDPAIWGTVGHAALLFRRGDVHPARERRTVFLGEDDMHEHATRGCWEVAAVRSTAEVRRIDVALGKEPPPNAVLLKLDEDPLAGEKVAIASDTGELRRDLKRSVGMIDTAGTQAAYGLTGQAGAIKLSSVELNVKTPYATVAVSSLTGRGIATSDHLMLTAVGRAENSGRRCNPLHTEVTLMGAAPVLIEPIEADIRIRTTAKLQVWPVLADGSRGAPLSATYEKGWLAFRIGAAAKTMYYEIAP